MFSVPMTCFAREAAVREREAFGGLRGEVLGANRVAIYKMRVQIKSRMKVYLRVDPSREFYPSRDG